MSEANDGYERYYTEKIWERIPGWYRDQDGRAATIDDRGGQHQLRALSELFGTQSAILRRSIDRLWDDEFIDRCDDWAVPYIGDLVATRLVSALDPRARRVDVANTIYYRRRAGTLRLLEELIGDIAGWEGVVVESFRTLARTWHGLDDTDPTPPSNGRVTTTPAGGTAQLTPRLGGQRTGTGFDELAYTADVRDHRGLNGRHGIEKLAFHHFRLSSVAVTQIEPTPAIDDRSFTIDPLGRDHPLFARPDRPLSFDRWVRLRPWQVPAPISCELLNQAVFILTPEAVAEVVGGGFGLSASAIADLEALRPSRYQNATDLRQALASTGSGAELTATPVRLAIEAASLIEDCGRWGLASTDSARLPSLRVEIDGTTVAVEELVAGDLSDWREPPDGAVVVIDPVRGRLRFAQTPTGPVRVDYHRAMVGPLGAGPHRPITAPSPTEERSGGGGFAAPGSLPGQPSVVVITDSLGYTPTDPWAVGEPLTVIAASNHQPVLNLSGQDLIIDTGTATDVDLVLDGLWFIGGASLVLRGDFATVEIRSCTLDPGTRADPDDGIDLVVEANIGALRVVSSVMGPITIDPAVVVAGIEICDSALEVADRNDPAGSSLHAPRTTIDIARSTVLGTVHCLRLWSTDSLFLSPLNVVDNQSGCFRFSATPPGSRTPRRYESTETPGTALFTTTRPTQPGYLQLLERVGADIARGAENTSQIGVYSAVGEPISLESLQIKVAEYLPVGRRPIHIFET